MASGQRTSVGPVTDKKEESFLEKLGTTLTRKKKDKATELEEAGRIALDGNLAIPVSLDKFLSDMEEGEERVLVDPESQNDPKLTDLKQILMDWVNDVLADQRIIVKDIQEDFYDGQVFQKLIEQLTNERVPAPEVSQSEIGQKQKLRVVLDYINRHLRQAWQQQQQPGGGAQGWPQQKWTVDCLASSIPHCPLKKPTVIHSKNMVGILHLLVALARYFRAPIRLPENVNVFVLTVARMNGVLQSRRTVEEVTTTNDDLGARYERDAFDTLFDHAPDKLSTVKRMLLQFVNKHLSKINLDVDELEKQLHDGVHLVLLMGLLEGYFVPLYSFHLTPTSFEQKVHNVTFAFELMEDAGLPAPKARPEDVVNLDVKSTLRVLYNLFTRYKTAP